MCKITLIPWAKDNAIVLVIKEPQDSPKATVVFTTLSDNSVTKLKLNTHTHTHTHTHHFLNTPEKNWQRRQWHPTPVLLPGKSHGQRSLVGCSPWGRWGSDTTERLHFHFSLSCVGEENGNPLVFLPGESQGRGSLVGCRLWGRTKSDTTEATAAAAASMDPTY